MLIQARKELTKAVNYVTGLKQQLNEASEKEEVMQSSLNAAAESESECLRLKALLADLQGQNARNDAAVSKELASLRSSNAVLSEQLEAAKAAQGIVDLESQAKQLSRISDLEKQVCDFESSVTPLAAAFEAAKAELLKQADLATEKDDKIIALQLSLTQKEFQNSASTTRKLDAEKAELQAHLNQLAAAFEAANGELEMKTVECSVAAGENIPNAVKIAEHIPIIQDLKEEIEAYEAVIARGKEEFKLLRAKLEEAQSGGGPSPLQQQMWEADKLKVVELDALVVSLRAQLQSASAQFSEYNSKVDDLNARETELAEASKNAAKALLEKETKIEDLTEQLTLSEDAYDRLKLQVDTELLVKMASLQTEVANFQVVVKQMEERLQTATAENISRADLDAALKRCEGLDSEKRDVLSEIAALEVSTAQKIEQAKQEMALVVQENNKNALMANNLTLEAENAAAKIAQQGLGLCEANAVIDNLTVSNTALEAERHLLNASLELQIATIAEHFDTIQAFQAEIAMFKRDHARSFAFCSKQISSLHELWELFGCTSSLVEFGEVGSLRLAEEQFDTLLQEMTPMIRTKHDSLLLSEKKLLADIEAIVCQLEHAQAEHKQVIAELEKLRSQSEQEKIQHASIDHSELSSLRNEHESVLETLAGKLDEVALFEQALMLAQNRIQEQEDRHNLDIKNLEELNFRILEADQRVKALEAERLELESDSEQRDNAAQVFIYNLGVT